MGTELPTKQTIEGAKLSHLKWLLYGPPGIGKSTFFSKAIDGKRKPLFLFTDPGLRFIKAYKKPIMNWREFRRTVSESIIKENPKIYSMIVIDTVDLLFRMCRREICLKRNIEHVSDEQWGKGYDLVRDEFEQCIAQLAVWCDNHETGLAFISHMKDVEIRGRTVKTNKLVPTLPKQGLDIVAPLCDIIGYAGFTQEKADKATNGEMGRVVIFEPDETVEAKDRTGMLPPKCKLDYDAVKEALEGGEEEEVVEDEEVVEE
jgi:hypothetical protein